MHVATGTVQHDIQVCQSTTYIPRVQTNPQQTPDLLILAFRITHPLTLSTHVQYVKDGMGHKDELSAALSAASPVRTRGIEARQAALLKGTALSKVALQRVERAEQTLVRVGHSRYTCLWGQVTHVI
jgi:hypothetical protein